MSFRWDRRSADTNADGRGQFKVCSRPSRRPACDARGVGSSTKRRTCISAAKSRRRDTNTHFESPALTDLSYRSIGGGIVNSGHQSIVQKNVKSRRNFAGLLAARLLATQEKVESNCRGACRK